MASKREEAFAAHRRGDLATAERLYRDLLLAAPSDVELLHYQGVLCYQTARVAESLTWLLKALALAPGSIPTLQLLIRAKAELGDAAGVLDALNRYLVLKPGDAGMLNLKGQQLVRLGRLLEARPVFRLAAEAGGSASMFHDLGLCCQLLGEQADAVNAYREALKRGYANPQTHLWLVQSLRAVGRTREYYEAAMNAVREVPDDIGILLEAQSARRYVCDWEGFEQDRTQMLAGIQHVLESESQIDIPPGLLNFLEVEEDVIAAVARRHARQLSMMGEEIRKKFPPLHPRETNNRIRLGYLSTDFFQHAVGSLVRDLFSCHDRSRFEVYGYSLRHQPDAVQSQIQQGCDTYRNLSGRSAEDIARIIHEDHIDILIDLAGYTSAAQPAVLAARLAPVQISWLGYLGTSGGDFIDYIIADDIALPPELAVHYTERVIRLPHFLVASPLPVEEQQPTRKEVGIGEAGFVFCSFNQPYKLDRATFHAWMSILQRVPGSILWLYSPDTEVCGQNLRREAAKLNVDPDRLVFAPRVPMGEHIARMVLADLALDPFHISGGATSITALAAGVPVLTLRGNSFLARMGSSINACLEMDDLDSILPENYIDKAVMLATEPVKLAAARARLKNRQSEDNYFDTSRFVQRLETAYQAVWARALQGLPPVDTQSARPDHAAYSRNNI